MGAKEGILTAHNEYTYDAKRGNLVEIRHNTDENAANDVVYTFEQDELGRQTAVKVGSQTLSQSVYQNDPTKPNFGTLTATTYGNGAKIRSRYDDFNRVTGVVYGEETAPRYEYDYNAKGQVARVRDNLLNRTTQSEYDLANRPVRVKTAEAGQHVYTGQVAYDNVYGNLSEFTEKVGENRQEFGTKFGYNDENRPTSLTYSIGATTIGQSTTTIDKLNRTTFSAVKLGSKTFTSEYHFAAGGYGTGSVTNLVASITQPGCNCGYGYDDNGNIASATLNGKWTGYSYDALGQLIQVNDHSDTRSGENGTTWKYTYDLGGNILKKERFVYNDTTTPLETVTYTYGDANWRDKLTAVNGSTIRYDAIGNPLNDGTWTYTWQNGRQLQKMQKSGVTAEFVYNADGLRVQKTVNGVATKYTLHGKNIVHMTSGTDELHFFYDAQNRPAVVVYNGVPYAYVKSLQGDIVAILDENGNTVVSYGYDAWGAPLWCTGELAETLGKVQPFRYRGYVFDEETGLYYLRSRYYTPTWCRFISIDAFVDTTDDVVSKSLFVYCSNNPIVHSDPTGEAWWEWAIGALVVVGCIAVAAATGGVAAAVVAGVTTAAAAIDGGYCAIESGGSFEDGFLAGAVGGAVSTLIPNPVVARGVSSAIYDVSYEYLDTGTVNPDNLPLYAYDVMLDMATSAVVYPYIPNGNKIIAAGMMGTADGLVDIAQTDVYNAYNAQPIPAAEPATEHGGGGRHF